MSNILITGASGFVGQNLIKYFSKKENIPTINLDLRNSFDQQKFNDVRSVVHLAGKAHDLKKSANPREYYEVNFELTKKLYNSFLESDAEKFIFVSSVKAVADSLEGILSEEFIPNPQTDYGRSKLMAEEYIQSQTLPVGKSYYILRPCMIHGPGNKGNLNLLYKFIQKGIPYPLAAFENKRSFLSIENLCFVIANLLKNEIPSGIYHIADDESLSTSEVVRILAASLDKKPRLWAIPHRLIRRLAKLGDILKLPINTERLNKLTENYVVSNEKIKRALKSELPISSKGGLSETAKSFGNL